MRKTYKIACLLIIVTIGFQYLLSAHRRTHAHECKREMSWGEIYIGEICYLPYRDGTLFRLYDAKTNELLAERTYSDMYPKMVFGNDRVYYSMSSDPEDYLLLPPTWLDRFRAKIP